MDTVPYLEAFLKASGLQQPCHLVVTRKSSAVLMPGVPPICTGSLSFSLPGTLEAKGWNGGWEATFLNS